MRALKTIGRIAAGIMIGVGALHLVAGFRSVSLLGVTLPEAVLANPVLDSQDRFYGAMLGGLGGLLLMALRDIQRYAAVIRVIAWTFVVGGLARTASIVVAGWPTPLVVLFIAAELILPACILTLLPRADRASA